ncbi:hypothetical protein L6307_01395 [Candidatus Parcubacteria bacterium]|nr:hypothetical protein [Candidatus Parcubacteria bacterium]
MDNHRLSLWCWLKFIENDNFKKYTLIYLDQHIDCACADFDSRYKKFLENKNRLKVLDEFRNSKHYFGKLSLINWQNFLAFAIKLEIFKYIFLFTKADFKETEIEVKYNTQEKINLKNITVYNSDTEKNLKNLFKNNLDIILDIDLDFFVEKKRNEDYYILNEKSIDACSEIIKKYSKKVFLTTIALSPECCGGWDNAEKILKCFTEKLSLNLEIPLRCCKPE